MQDVKTRKQVEKSYWTLLNAFALIQLRSKRFLKGAILYLCFFILFQTNLGSQTTIDLSALNLNAGIYLFKLMNLQSGKSEHKKVIYHVSR